MSMKVLVNGACGRMGQEVCRMCREGERDAVLTTRVDAFGNEAGVVNAIPSSGDDDVAIDFSNHAGTEALLAACVARKMPVVIATTGHTDEEKKMIEAASSVIPIFFSANMSVGVALLVELAKTTARVFPDADIEIIETHHNRKVDAPSGTALMIADALRTVRTDATYVYGRAGQHKREPNEIGIHAVRMGNVIGEHEVRIGTDTQTITLRHQAHSRALFAEGAIAAAAWLVGRAPGLYNMQDMLK